MLHVPYIWLWSNLMVIVKTLAIWHTIFFLWMSKLNCDLLIQVFSQTFACLTGFFFRVSSLSLQSGVIQHRQGKCFFLYKKIHIALKNFLGNMNLHYIYMSQLISPYSVVFLCSKWLGAISTNYCMQMGSKPTTWYIHLKCLVHWLPTRKSVELNVHACKNIFLAIS